MIGQTIKFSVLFLALFSTTQVAFATILVEPGTYELQTLVLTEGRAEPEAVFNLRTRSELRVKLTGPLAKKLLMQKSDVLKIKFKIKGKIQSSHTDAELLGVTVGDGAEAPLLVCNDFKPCKQKEGY